MAVRGGVILAGLSTLFMLVGCSKPVDQPTKSNENGMMVVASRPSITASPERIDSTAGKVLPIGAYQIRAEAQVAVIRAERVLVAKCMARFGFSDPNAWLPDPVVDKDPLARRYGIMDASVAAQWGYHLPPGYKGGPDETTLRNRPRLSEAELLVLTGSPNGQPSPPPAKGLSYGGTAVPQGGCTEEARLQLAPGGQLDSNTDPELVRRINGSEQDDSDPLVVKVTADWAKCMRDKGFDRTRPVKDPNVKNRGPKPTLSEIQEAAADVTCKKETNLFGVWFTVESAYQAVMIQENIAALIEIKNENDAIVRRATDVVTSGGLMR